MSQQINLFNPVFLRRRQPFRARQMAVWLAVVLAGAVVITGFSHSQMQPVEQESRQMSAMLAARQARLAAVKVEFAPRASDPALKGEVERNEAHLRSLNHVSDIVKRGEAGGMQGYGEYFRALARQSVNGLWLTEVAVQDAGADIALQGRVMQAALLPQYMARLANEPALRGKNFGQLEINRPPGPELSPVLSTTAPGATADAPVAPQPRFLEFRLRSGSAAPADAGAPVSKAPGAKP